MNFGTSRRNAVIAICVLALSVTSTLGQRDDQRQVDYSSWEIRNVTWSSSTSHLARGMTPFYKMTNLALSLFETDNPIPDGYIIVSHGKVELGPKIQENDYGDLLKEHWGLLLIVCLSALVIVLAPIVGLCFCCCRCAGACGGRSEPFDKKHDTCRRVFMGLLLFCAGTGMVFGVVIAFMTNSYLEQGIKNVTLSTRYGVNDTRKYLDITASEIDHLLVDNYAELNQHLSEMLDEVAENITQDLQETSKAVSVTQLNEFVQTLPKIKRDLLEIKDISAALKLNATDLSNSLRKIQFELLQYLNECKHQSCKNFRAEYELSDIKTDIHYDRLPEVQDYINDIDDKVSGNLMSYLDESNNVVERLKLSVKSTIEESVLKVKNAINEVGVAVKDMSKTIDREIQKYSTEMDTQSSRYLDDADDYIEEYSKYRYYFGLAVASVLLLVLICVAFGLLCGICGKRPDGYGDDCCNKGAGSRFLMIGVAVIFLTISVITLAALIHFIVGLVLHRVACVSMKNPSNDPIFKYVDDFVNLDELFPENSAVRRNSKLQRVLKDASAETEFKLSKIIESCHRNQAAFKVFRLEKAYNVDKIRDYPKQFKIEELLQQLIDSLEIEGQSHIINSTIKEEIMRFSNSKLNDFDSTTFDQYLSDNITKSNLSELYVRLIETVNSIPQNDEFKQIKDNIRLNALSLNMINQLMVMPMMDATKRILLLTRNLDKSFKFNAPSFKQAIVTFEKEMEDAETFINKQGTEHVQDALRSLMESFTTEINEYLEMAILKTKTEVGRCAPLSHVYNATLVAACDRIIDPWNGFWAGVSWCVLLFLPTIILSAKLSSLYQKSDPYPGPLVESEYLYDAYSERDNIPLANGPKNKRRKKNDRRRDHRDYYEDSSSSHGPPASSSRDARYTDMAPKHWDGGPPRYQNPPMAPSEYERPPPYYFPGTTAADD